MTMNDSHPPKLDRRFSLPTPLVFALLILSGCAPSKQQQALDVYNRGVAYLNKGEYDEAIADFTEAIRLNPEFAEVYYNRGLTYGRDKGDFENAIADFTEAIRLKPDYAEAYYNRDIAEFSNGDTDKAIADHTEAIRLKPDYAKAYYNRGVAFEDRGDKSKAEQDFTKAKELGYEPE